MDPDPGGPKTPGSGSATLVRRVLDNLTSFSFKEVKDQNMKMTEARAEADVEKEAIKTEFKKQVFNNSRIAEPRIRIIFGKLDPDLH
jgi:FtsZ-binding cell division protein ZapB